jgi:hypothetical protein
MRSNPKLNNFKYFSYNYYPQDNWEPIVEDISLSFNVGDIPFSYQQNNINEENPADVFNPFNALSKFSLSNSNIKDSGLLPPGFISLNDTILIFEKPPTHKLVNCYSTSLDEINGNTPCHSYYLPIPWQLYIVEFDPVSCRTFNVKMFFMQTSLQDFNQQLFLPPIPNFYVNGQLCRPFFSSMDDIERYPQNLSGIIASAYDWIWSSNFNLDLTETISSIYFQQNPIQISRNIRDRKYIEYKTPMDVIHETYSHWESLTLSEVSSFVWPNPAFSQTFNEDISNIDYTQEFEQWCQLHDIEIEDEEDYDNHYNSDDFRSSIQNPRFIKKTLKMIMDYNHSRKLFTVESNSLESMMISLITSLQTT